MWVSIVIRVHATLSFQIVLNSPTRLLKTELPNDSLSSGYDGAKERLGYPYSQIFPIYSLWTMWSRLELRIEFPNHLIVKPPSNPIKTRSNPIRSPFHDMKHGEFALSLRVLLGPFAECTARWGADSLGVSTAIGPHGSSVLSLAASSLLPCGRPTTKQFSVHVLEWSWMYL